MTTPFPIPTPFAPTGSVTQASLDLKYTKALNDLYTLLQPALGGRLQYTQTTGGQALTNGAFTVITGFNSTADVDTLSGGGSFAPSTGIWTCPTGADGTYQVNGQVTATGATAVRLIAGLQKNGSTVYSAYQSGAPTTWATALLEAKDFVLAAGDTLSLLGNVNAAAIVTGVQNGNGSFLRIVRVA